MDSQMVRQQLGSSYEHEPHSASLHSGEGGDEHQPDKKSVLKKVKAKAKKIKDTLKLHGYGHHDDQDQLHHDRDHVPDDHDLNEEDDEDEDEEMADDPEVYGAPGFGSAAIRNSVPEQVDKSGDMRTNYGSSAAMKNQEDSSGYSEAKVTGSLLSFGPVQEEDTGIKVGVDRTEEVPQSPLNTPASVTPGITDQPKATNPIQGFAQEQVSIRGQPQIDLKHSPRFEEDPEAPKNRPQDHKPSNYETKVGDPTSEGSKEAEFSSILHSLDKMNLSGESKQRAAENLHTGQRDVSIFPTGSHDQFSSEPTPPIPISSQESPQSVSEISYASKSEDHPRNDTTEKAPKQSSYTEKMSSATSAIADKAISAKNVVVSKLGYGEKDNTKEPEIHEEQEENAKPASPVAYGKRIASTVTQKLTPVYEKVAEKGSNLISKAPGAGTNNGGQDKGVSVKDYLAEKLKPGEEDRALSEVISERLHKQKNETQKTDKKSGKVTESEEVKRQLGSAEENSGERVDQGSVQVPEIGVVNKIKGMVGSYFGKGTEPLSSSQQSHGSSTGTEGFSNSEEDKGERRLQESGN